MEKSPEQVLVEQCVSIAGGLEQQATAAQSGTALGGHPNPAYFYGQAASVLRAAGELILKQAKRINQLEEAGLATVVGGVDPVTAGAETTAKVEVAGAADTPADIPPTESKPKGNRNR